MGGFSLSSIVCLEQDGIAINDLLQLSHMPVVTHGNTWPIADTSVKAAII